jgi:hypothetical protein
MLVTSLMCRYYDFEPKGSFQSLEKEKNYLFELKLATGVPDAPDTKQGTKMLLAPVRRSPTNTLLLINLSRVMLLRLS